MEYRVSALRSRHAVAASDEPLRLAPRRTAVALAAAVLAGATVPALLVAADPGPAPGAPGRTAA
ncbi:hypothetical protein ACWEQL_35805, partial [Kitasatospora sp. NPDC004240]